MALSSVNPFALGNVERSYGASTFRAVEPVKSDVQNVKAEGFKGFATTEDIERASQFIEGNITSSSKVQEASLKKTTEPKGSLFEGFDVSNWQGSPIYQEGEKIYDYIA